MSAKVDLSEYTIRLASPSQDREQLEACYIPWGRGQTWDAYVEEGQRFRAGNFSKDGACATWVLVRKDDYDGPIYSGLRTLRRKTLIKRPGSDAIEETVSYGLFAVVTPVQHLRKGFANHLCKLLHYHLGHLSSLPPFPTHIWGTSPPPLSVDERKIVPPGISSILSSGVGSSFYEKATIGPDLPGWVVPHDECQQIAWNLSPPSDLPSPEGKWEWIYPRDLPSIGEILSQRLRNRMKEMNNEELIWSPDPSSTGILDYVVYAGYRSRPKAPLSHRESEPCGIRFPSGNGGEESIVLFSIFSYGLAVTCVDGLSVEDLPLMLQLLDEQGGKAGAKDARSWGMKLDSDLGKAWAGVKGREVKVGAKEVETGDLLAVAWYGDGDVKDDRKGHMADTQTWCWA